MHKTAQGKTERKICSVLKDLRSFALMTPKNNWARLRSFAPVLRSERKFQHGILPNFALNRTECNWAQNI